MSLDVSRPIRVCRACRNPDLTLVLSLGDQFVSDFPRDAGALVHKVPLDVVRCGGCGLVQLRHTVSRDLIYKHDYWYKSSASSTMVRALADIVDKTLALVQPHRNDLVLDIGSNDGSLLRLYPTNLMLHKVGFEPSWVAEESSDAGTIIQDYFSRSAYEERFGATKAKIITSVSMFYDLEDPEIFVQNVRDCLSRDGVWVIQQNYLGTMLEQNGYDNICHEHLAYHSLGSMKPLLDRNSLEVFKTEINDVNGGSFRTYVAHEGQREVDPSVTRIELYENRMKLDDPATYRKFSQSILEQRNKTHEFIETVVKKGEKVYVYGASTRGNTILQYCGLDHRLIKAATDNNPAKWGRRTVGTDIPIIPHDKAMEERPDYFLVLPVHFLREILAIERGYLESGGKFIIPLPQFRIVTA